MASALEAAVADLMGLVPAVDAAASAREVLARKCPRFLPSSEPVLPMLDARAQLRQIVIGLPASVEAEEIPLDDVGVYYSFGASVSAAQAKRVAA